MERDGTSNTTTAASRSIDRGTLIRIGAATVGAAILANAIFYYIGSTFVRYDDDFLPLASVGPTIFFTFIFSTIAVLVYTALQRFSANPVRTFLIVAAIALGISALPDLFALPSEEGASNGQIAILLSMHVIAAAIIVGMLTTLAHPDRR